MSSAGMHAGPVAGTFLASLDEAQRAGLQRYGVVRDFPPGAILMFEREPDKRVTALLAGRVKVSRVDSDGRELMLRGAAIMPRKLQGASHPRLRPIQTTDVRTSPQRARQRW